MESHPLTHKTININNRIIIDIIIIAAVGIVENIVETVLEKDLRQPHPPFLEMFLQQTQGVAEVWCPL